MGIAQPYDYTNKNNHFLQSATGITYDNMGDVTKDGSGSSYNTYTYDAEGRPVTVNSVSTTFDAFNRAVEQYSLGVATQIVYSPTGQKFSYMTNGQTLKSYVLPMVAGMQVVYNSTGLQYFRQVDWLGSGRFATNSSGGVYYDASYGPWGETFNEQGTNDRLFTGQTQDPISGPGQGVYNFLLRQHSPTEGRWLVPDPAGVAAVDITNPQTWNRYGYVGNNPLSRIDPLGLRWRCTGNPEETDPTQPDFPSCWDDGAIEAGGTGVISSTHIIRSRPQAPPPKLPDTETKEQRCWQAAALKAGLAAAYEFLGIPNTTEDLAVDVGARATKIAESPGLQAAAAATIATMAPRTVALFAGETMAKAIPFVGWGIVLYEGFEAGKAAVTTYESSYDECMAQP